MRWGSLLSNSTTASYWVRQGSILGPISFILLTSDLPKHIDKDKCTRYLYADDTTSIIIGSTWEEVRSELSLPSTRLREYSQARGLCLNTNKTQAVLVGPGVDMSPIPSLRDQSTLVTPTRSINVLGFKLDDRLKLNQHNEQIQSDLVKRLGLIRRLGAHLPRGPLMREMVRALVVGRLQVGAWVTRMACIGNSGKQTHYDRSTQTILNNLARTITGSKRSDRTRIRTIASLSGIPTLNEIIIRLAANAAWNAANGGTLNHLLSCNDPRTRATASGLLRPSSHTLPYLINVVIRLFFRTLFTHHYILIR